MEKSHDRLYKKEEEETSEGSSSATGKSNGLKTCSGPVPPHSSDQPTPACAFSSKDRSSFVNERVLPCAYIMKASTLVWGDTQKVTILAIWDKRRKLWDVLNSTKGIRGFLRNKALCMTLTSIFIYLFIIFGGSWGAGRSAGKQSKQSTLKPDVCVCVRDTDRER